jgi:hypothetical protein
VELWLRGLPLKEKAQTGKGIPERRLHLALGHLPKQPQVGDRGPGGLQEFLDERHGQEIVTAEVAAAPGIPGRANHP